MSKKILTTPIKSEDLTDIQAGDIIYLNGHIVTCRDVAHRRLIEGGRELPVDINGGAILHAGPIVRPIPDSDDKFE
ncbi:fumarate hydratase C-terminal domain-containing protein, partial [Klebsiella oxytoca]|nr:fumarate hydratase C-terminal domain-containing protein [Klebsiella oxytoca]